MNEYVIRHCNFDNRDTVSYTHQMCIRDSVMGDCWQPFVGRVIMNFYMRHSKEGDVKISSEAELVSMLSAYFHNVSWEQVGNTACIAMCEK